MTKTQLVQPGWRKKLVDHLTEYLINVGYLAFFLIAFGWYRRFILAEYQLQQLNFWFPLIEALVLARVIMLGDMLRLSRGLEQKPLIQSALFRTVIFSLLTGVFELLEATIRGLFHHDGLAGGFQAIASRGKYEFFARCVVVFAAFVPFFCFRELERVLGREQLRALFWRRGEAAAASAQ